MLEDWQEYHRQSLELRVQGQFSEALKACFKACQLLPSDPLLLSNLALAYQDLGDLAQALYYFKKAWELEPGNYRLQANLGQAQLMAGDFAKGFLNWSARLRESHIEGEINRLGFPLWRGENLEGKRILLHSEQGLGDVLQFARFIPLLQKEGAETIVSAPDPLLRLLAGLGPVISNREEVPACDYQIPLIDVAIWRNWWECPFPYLKADPGLVKHWGRQLPKKGRNIGILWQGNPRMAADNFRSLKPEDVLALREIPGVNWISLQVERSELSLPQTFLDLADVVAVLMGLEMVVSVDSAVLHLASGLGTKTIGLIRYNPDWRWPPLAVTSPWYPRLCLIRQQIPGNWGKEIVKVRKILEN